MKSKLLLVEDEDTLAELLLESLNTAGYEVFRAKNGEEGFALYKKYKPDLCIFDIMMPVCDGFTLLQNVRRIDRNVYIFMLTAKSMKDDIVKGLELGADDYVIKPFSFKELQLRLKNAVRRSTPNQTIFQIGKYQFDFNKQLLKYQSFEQSLTHMESRVLNYLNEHRNSVTNRMDISSEIWGTSDFFGFRSIDVFVSKLRKYLKKDPDIQIVSIRGIGYKMIVD